MECELQGQTWLEGGHEQRGPELRLGGGPAKFVHGVKDACDPARFRPRSVVAAVLSVGSTQPMDLRCRT